MAKNDAHGNEQPEEIIIGAVAYGLWEEWVDQLIADGGEAPENIAAIKRYAKIAGVADNSAMAFMYRGFLAGLNKGMELAERMGSLEIDNEKPTED